MHVEFETLKHFKKLTTNLIAVVTCVKQPHSKIRSPCAKAVPKVLRLGNEARPVEALAAMWVVVVQSLTRGQAPGGRGS